MAVFEKCLRRSVIQSRHLRMPVILMPLVVHVMVAGVFAQQSNNAGSIMPGQFSIQPTAKYDKLSPTNIYVEPQLKFNLIDIRNCSEDRLLDKKENDEGQSNQAFHYHPSLRLILINMIGIKFQNIKSVALKPPQHEQADSENGNAISGDAQTRNSSIQKDTDDTEIIPVLGSVVTSGKSYKPLNGRQRYKLFLMQNFTTPHAYLKLLLPALQNQLSNSPAEWGYGGAGLGERYLSNMGQSLIQSSIQTTTASMLGLDTRYILCPCKGYFRRFGHALLFNFLTYNKKGETRLDLSGIGATYATYVISSSWYPHRDSAIRNGFHNTAQQMIFGGFFNLIDEFWPEIKRVVKRKRR